MNKKNVLLASCFLLLAGCGKNETNVYPASTLTEEPGETVYKKASYFSAETTLPSLPYIVAMTENIDSFGEDYKQGTLSYNNCDYNIIIYEPDGEMGNSLMEIGHLITDADITYSTDKYTGYINGYSAAYVTGCMSYTLNEADYEKYITAYNLTLPDDSADVVFYISCDNLDALGDAKVLLDEMVYSIHKSEESSSELAQIDIINSDTESGTEVLDNFTESTEIPLEELEFAPVELSVLEKGDITFQYEVDLNGYCRTIADHPFEVSGEYDELFVVLSFYAQDVPASICIQTPEGTKYYKSDEFSYPDEYVFIIPSAGSGTYDLHIETYTAVYNCTIACLDKEVYYMMYLNMDENGEPLRGM